MRFSSAKLLDTDDPFGVNDIYDMEVVVDDGDDFEQPLSTEVTLSVLPEPERVK